MANVTISERLLGFDARDCWLHAAQLWPVARRKDFLISESFRKPLSVDRSAWPSIFDRGYWASSYFSSLSPDDSKLQTLGGRYYLDLNELTSTLERSSVPDHFPYTVIAISWVSDCDFADEVSEYLKEEDFEGLVYYSPGFGAMNPKGRDPAWSLLGYDVADYSLCSAVCNCGRFEEERIEESLKYGIHLNEYHLFNTVEHAFDYRTKKNAEGGSHAPFYVFAVRYVSGVKP